MIIKTALRQTKIKNGRQSLYLDFYPAITHPETGKATRREFLGLYVYEYPKTAIEKLHNNDTLKIANGIRQKRDNILNKPEIYYHYEKEQIRVRDLNDQCFITYFREQANKRKSSNHATWISALNYLESFTQGELKFSGINEKVLNDFKEYLLTEKSKRSNKTSLSQNSAVSYFNKVKATLKQAYKEGILQTDFNARVDAIKEEETRREFLTMEELNQLVKTPCNYPVLKRAALFSALTGLRFSDIEKLVWGELDFVKGQGHYINFIQKKTKAVEYFPISVQAYKLLGERRDSAEKVFLELKYSAYHNKHLFQWIGAAGITKNITFHCFRHTYATLQLHLGTDIYTVSKMLGHKNLKATQVYVKVVDQAKRKAAGKIKLDF